MKQINLLPQSSRVRSAKQRTISVFVLSFLLAVGGVAGTWMILRAEVASVQALVEEKKVAEVKRLEEATKKQQALGISADLSSRVATLNSMSTTETDWNKAFSLVGKIMPKDTVLASFEYANAPGLFTLKFTGTSPSNVSFATFVESLRANKEDIVSVKVDGYIFTPASGLVTFGMTLQVKPSVVQYTHGS